MLLFRFGFNNVSEIQEEESDRIGETGRNEEQDASPTWTLPSSLAAPFQPRGCSWLA